MFASHVPHEAFNENKIQFELAQSQLGLILDPKLYFHQPIDDKINKYNEIIWTLFRKSSLTIYKSFSRPLLDYADINYDKRYNASFKVKLEAVQYNACLAITGAIRGASLERFSCNVGLEPANHHRLSRKVFVFHQIIRRFSPSYQQKFGCQNLTLHKNADILRFAINFLKVLIVYFIRAN